MRSLAAFAMYIALVVAHLAGISAVGFALLAACVLSLGLWAHTVELPSSSKRLVHTHSTPDSIVPSLSESMDQLLILQTEINELQAQFALDTQSQASSDQSYGSAS